MDRWIPRVVGGACAVVAAIALWFTLSTAATPEPVLVAVPPPEVKPAPIVPPPPRQRVYHLPPPGADQPEEKPPTAAAALQPDETRAFQRAGITAAGRAKEACLAPWAQEADTHVEVVMDAVVHDGVVADVQLRTLTELPQHVLDCVRDEAWSIEWPEAEDAPGQVRFQHTIEVGLPLLPE